MRSLLRALAAAVLCAAPLAAQPLILGPEMPVISPNRGASGAQVAAAPHGGFAVVWQEDQIFLRIFGADGTPLTGALQLSEPIPGLAHGSQRIAALASGGYVVVWADIDNSQFEPFHPERVSGRIVDATGQPVGPEFRLPDGTTSPDVAAYPSGGFVLTWFRFVPPSLQKSAGRFDDSGAPVGGEVVVDVGENHKMATLPGDRLVLVWERLFPVSESHVAFRIFGPDLLPAGPEVRVHGQEPDNAWPQIASDATGRFVIAWRDADSGIAGQPTAPQQVRARIFGPDGAAQSPEILVYTAPTLQDRHFPSAVALRPDGSFLVVWLTLDQFDPFPDLFARWYRPDGTPGGEPFPVPLTSGSQAVADAAPTSDGWVVSWSNSGSDSVDANGLRIRQLRLPCSGLCLNGNRFRATVTWRVPSTGAEGTGTPIPLTGDTGAFWFFQPSNYELAVKLLDGRGVNGHFWVFYGSLTNVEFDLTVTDTLTGQQRTYHNPAGTMASQADTTAF